MPLTNQDIYTNIRPDIKLFNTQCDAIQFMFSLEADDPSERNGGMINHEMGCGKTFSVIAFIFAMSEYYKRIDDTTKRTTLIVAPANLIPTWKKEIKSKTTIPSDKIFVYTGDDRREIPVDQYYKYSIVLASSQTVAVDLEMTDKKVLKQQSSTLFTFPWYRIFVDEAHTLNQSAKIFYALNRLKGIKRFVLTGSPWKKDVVRFVSMFKFIWGSDDARTSKYIWTSKNSEERDEFKNKYIHIRTIEDTGLTMPELFDETIYYTFFPWENNIYQEQLSQLNCYNNPAAYCFVRRFSVHYLIAKLGRTATIGLSRSKYSSRKKSKVIKSRCINGGGQLFDGDECDFESIELDDCSDTVGRTFKCGHVVCSNCINKMKECYFCTFEKPLLTKLNSVSFKEESDSEDESSSDEDSSTSEEESDSEDESSSDNDDVEKINHSKKIHLNVDLGSKIIRLLQLLSDLLKDKKFENDKIIIFSEWTSSLDLVEYAISLYFPRLGIARYDGDVLIHKKNQVLSDFTESNHQRILLMTFGSGSLGLNIQAANHIIFLEPNWDPSIEKQALARAYRPGQTKNVYVWRLINNSSRSAERLLVEVVKADKEHDSKFIFDNIGTSNKRRLTERGRGLRVTNATVQELFHTIKKQKL